MVNPPRTSGKHGAASAGSSSAQATGVKDLALLILSDYLNSTPKRLKIIDAYLIYVMLTGAVQMLYCLLVGTFPFNSFLSGFISCVASFVLGVALRIQCNPANSALFSPQPEELALEQSAAGALPEKTARGSEASGITPERAFADFLFAHLVLHLFVCNFIG